jgi:hypothetical protein
MAVYPCVRFRTKSHNGANRDYVVCLTDTRLRWYGIPEILHPSGTGWCYPHSERIHLREKLVAIRVAVLLAGYKDEDHILVDDDNMIVDEGITTANEAISMIPTRPDQQEAGEGSEMPPDPFYWELEILSAPPPTLIRTIVYEEAAIVSKSMPDYTYCDALWALLDHGGAITSGSDAAGEIPKDGSVQTLGHLLVLCKTANVLDALWSQYAHLSVINGEWVLKSNGSLDTIAVLQAAGLDRDDKKAPATLAAIALGLLPTPIDLSAAPVDDFYL